MVAILDYSRWPPAKNVFIDTQSSIQQRVTVFNSKFNLSFWGQGILIVWGIRKTVFPIFFYCGYGSHLGFQNGHLKINFWSYFRF